MKKLLMVIVLSAMIFADIPDNTEINETQEINGYTTFRIGNVRGVCLNNVVYYYGVNNLSMSFNLKRKEPYYCDRVETVTKERGLFGKIIDVKKETIVIKYSIDG